MAWLGEGAVHHTAPSLFLATRKYVMNWQQFWAALAGFGLVAFIFFLAVLCFRMGENEVKHPETVPRGDTPGCGPGCLGLMLIMIGTYILILLLRALSGDLI